MRASGDRGERRQTGTEHPVAALVREMWPVLEATAGRHRSSAQVFEKLSRFFKHAMRTCKGHFEPLLKVTNPESYGFWGGASRHYRVGVVCCGAVLLAFCCVESARGAASDALVVFLMDV